MHKSFASPALPGPGNSGAFNFLIFKAVKSIYTDPNKFIPTTFAVLVKMVLLMIIIIISVFLCLWLGF